MEKIVVLKKIISLKACSSVDRVPDSDSDGQGFDSLHAYELIPIRSFRDCSGFDI
jgi:hypothetical protein